MRLVGAGVNGRSNTAQGTVTDEALCCLQGEQEVRYGQETTQHIRRQVIYLDVLLAVRSRLK